MLDLCLFNLTPGPSQALPDHGLVLLQLEHLSRAHAGQDDQVGQVALLRSRSDSGGTAGLVSVVWVNVETARPFDVALFLAAIGALILGQPGDFS